MSVINAMLSKLDQRGVGAAQGHGLPASAPIATLPRRANAGWRLPAIVLVGGVAIAATALADWPAMLRTGAADLATTPALNAAVAPPADASAAAAAPAAPTAAAAVAAPADPAATVALPAAAVPPPAWPARMLALAPATTARSSPVVPPAPAAATPPLPLASALAATLAPPLPARIDKRPLPPTPEQRVLALYRGAVDAAQAGQRQAALAQAQQALALDARHAPSRLLAGVLAYESGDAAQAMQLLREGLALDPQQPAQALLLARVLVAQGDAASALVALDQHGVSGADADGLRGGVLAQQGDFRRALAAYESAARQQPMNPMWWLGLGVALDSEGQRPRARQAYAKARAIGLPRDDLASFVEQRLAGAD